MMRRLLVSLALTLLPTIVPAAQGGPPPLPDDASPPPALFDVGPASVVSPPSPSPSPSPSPPPLPVGLPPEPPEPFENPDDAPSSESGLQATSAAMASKQRGMWR